MRRMFPCFGTTDVPLLWKEGHDRCSLLCCGRRPLLWGSKMGRIKQSINDRIDNKIIPILSSRKKTMNES